jgi:hypothetical protein
MTTTHELDTWLIAQLPNGNGGTLDTNRMHTLTNSFVDYYPSKKISHKLETTKIQTPVFLLQLPAFDVFII